MPHVNRREFFGLAGAAAGALVLARSVRPDEAFASVPLAPAPTTPAVTPAAAQDSAFLDVSAGTKIGAWTVSKVYPVTLGAVPIVLESASGRFQVDVLRRADHGPSGIGNSDRLSVYLCNGGNGATRTDENHGLAAMALAEHFRAVEKGADLSSLLTLEERQARHPGQAFVVL